MTTARGGRSPRRWPARGRAFRRPESELLLFVLVGVVLVEIEVVVVVIVLVVFVLVVVEIVVVVVFFLIEVVDELVVLAVELHANREEVTVVLGDSEEFHVAPLPVVGPHRAPA